MTYAFLGRSGSPSLNAEPHQSGHRLSALVLCVWLGMAALFAIAVSHVLISRTVNNAHKHEAENAARISATILASTTIITSKTLREKLLSAEPGDLPPSLLGLSDLMQSLNVTRIKLFDHQGNLLASNSRTQIEAVGSTRGPSSSHALAAATSRNTVARSAWSNGPEGRRTYTSSAYAPVVEGSSVHAVIEVYLDQTANAVEHQKSALYLSMAVALIVLGAVGLPAMILLNKSRKITRVERDRHAQNKRFMEAVESLPHGFSMFDSESRLIVCNSSFQRMYGFPDDAVRPGTRFEDLVRYAVNAKIVKNQGDLKHALHRALESLDVNREEILELVDGRVIGITISHQRDGGHVSVHQDVTEKYKWAERIAASEARFRDYAATAADWCWETDADHRFTLLTEGFRNATGIDPSTVLGKTRAETFVEPDDIEPIGRLEGLQLERRPFRDVFVRVSKPSGGHVSIRSSGAPRFGEDGTFLGFRGTARDVTSEELQKAELERAKEALQLRTQQLMEAQRLGKIGHWRLSLDRTEREWSTETYALLRIDPKTGPPPLVDLIAACVGDGIERAQASFREAARSRTPQKVDVKMRCGDGTVVDCAIITSAVFDKAGILTGFCGTVQDISDRKRAEEKLEQIAFYDQLTGLPNRTLFTRELDELVADGGENNAALLLVDLDRFKDVNDSFGHASGDELLSKVSAIISSRLRSEHLLARIGGDEFAIIVKESSGRDEVMAIAQSVIEAVSDPILLALGEVTVGASIGIAFPEAGISASNLFREADLALYKAKESGRGCFELFQQQMDGELQHKIRLERDLKRALSEEFGLEVHYQPLADLRKGEINGFEALIRWKHPDLGQVPPSQFIPVAENSRLIVDVGRWVLRQAARQMKAWIDAGHKPGEISVNVSAAQLWHSDLVSDVSEILAETGLPPEFLCLELTESLLADPSEQRVRSEIGRLKSLGVKLALDDFGTDYSSLGYLTQLPFDKLKIDRVFVDGVATSDRRRELLKGIIALGHGLGMTVVGEGAERPEELELLALLGCDVAQGYVLSRPLPAVQALAAAANFRLPARENGVHAMQSRLLSEAV